jgi:hypothetical protein
MKSPRRPRGKTVQPCASPIPYLWLHGSPRLLSPGAELASNGRRLQVNADSGFEPDTEIIKNPALPFSFLALLFSFCL